MTHISKLSIPLGAVITLAMTGCGQPSGAPNNSNAPAPSATLTSPNTDMEKMKAELAKLSPEDAASAEKQHVCPVSGKMLGTMGPPQKMDVNGQQVWICCDGCTEILLKDPDEYLAKLKKE